MSLLPVGVIPVEGAYSINNSLRFRASASAWLNRTNGTSTNQSRGTWSFWFKRGQLGVAQRVFEGKTANTDAGVMAIEFFADDTLVIGGWNANWRITTQVFRDPSAWYHIVLAVDTTQTTANNRILVYVNGTQITAFGTTNNPVQNSTFGLNNNSSALLIGRDSYALNRFVDGYLAEVNFIDGQALTPSSFGETNTTTGVWQPKAYTGTYGTNGYYLKFSNAGSSAVLVNTTTAVQNTNSTTITVNVPAGTNNNDLMILVATVGSVSSTWTTPSGWTLWGNNGGRTVFYRTASSEPASYTLTQSANVTSSACILTYRNAAIDVFGTYSANASPSDAPSITTTANNAVVFYYVAGRTNSSQTYTTPTNFTSLVSDSDATNPSYAVFSRVQATAGATGTATTTPSAGSAMSVQFSIKTISNTNLGLDFSGNGNNWTTNNISVIAGTTYDAMTDSPTLTSATVANYPTLNPLSNTSTLTEANLSASNIELVGTTMATPSSGKWYFEYTQTTSIPSGSLWVGVASNLNAIPDNQLQGYSYASDGRKVAYNSYTSGYGATWTNGDVIGCALDLDGGTITFYKNGVSQGTAFTGITIQPYVFALSRGGVASTKGGSINCGQRPFAYTPPTGFNRLNAFNLPTSTIVKGNSFMDATTYTGNGFPTAGTQSIVNAGAFRPDFVWIKDRSNGTNFHALFDSIRGINNRLFSNTTDAQNTTTGTLTAFNSNGFTLGSQEGQNANGNSLVAWQWQAGQGSTSTNTAGSITSTVSVNTTTGFSIVTFTGNGVNSTVGHGLGVAPRMIIEKERSLASSWATYHASLGATKAVYLNLTNAEETQLAFWNSTAPTSTVFSLGTDGDTNSNGVTYVAYCWAQIPGFSAFGSYTGNGSANGPFVYLGFRPKFVMVKRTDSATFANWWMEDSTRNTFNPTGLDLQANTANAEANNSPIYDFLSNGYKLRTSLGGTNASGGTYIYAAFAENPFKNALAR